MFFIGIYGFLTRRNLITMFMSIELILNSVNINFVVFNQYLYPGSFRVTFLPFLSSPLLQPRLQLPSP